MWYFRFAEASFWSAASIFVVEEGLLLGEFVVLLLEFVLLFFGGFEVIGGDGLELFEFAFGAEEVLAAEVELFFVVFE